MSNVHQLALPGVAAAEPAVEWVWSEDTEEEALVFVHATVMKDEILVALAPQPGGVYVDVTLGAGGHTEAILQAAEGARVIAFDRDAKAIAAARARLAPFGERVTYVPESFANVRASLDSLGIRAVDGLCADLGVSSPQLDDAERGMSFRREGPIDMRMDQDHGETALELIDRLSDEALADVIFRYGDERRSRRIARSIKRRRARDDARPAARDRTRGGASAGWRRRPGDAHVPGLANRGEPGARRAGGAPPRAS
jgi:16S rRNA (cytosine1402-N4)-methyltransferase